jgi:hypothetical protein
MSYMLRRVALLATAAAGASVLVGGPAFAQQPTFEHFGGSFTEVDDETCGFPITIEETFSADVIFFYDAAGNLVRSINHLQLRGTDSANGVSLAQNANFTHTFDFTTGTNGDLGLQTQVIVPGGGTVLIEAGRVLSDEEGNLQFVAGKHQLIAGDVSAYCAALSG